MPARRASGLRGRSREVTALAQLLHDVRGQQSRVLVLRGDSGVGKTALLEHLASTAAGCRIAWASGVESEMELAFAGLHQLFAPLLDHARGLPGPQRGALDIAFGLDSGATPDRFIVGLATLGLLSEAAGERPLVCLVDDAQWLDRASAQALAFASRRLLADSVAMVFATRDGADAPELAGLPELTVEGLSESDSIDLLASVIPGHLDDQVLDRILAETRGNPLALLELPRGLNAAELEFGFGLPDAMPLTSRIEANFLRQYEALPDDTRRLLLAAAVEPVGDVTALWRAAERLGIPVAAATPAEDAGLISLGVRVRFRHPLIRSAAVRSADRRQIQDVHRALAEVTDPEREPDRHAWHRAHAAAGPSEDVAAALELAADRARRRGGVAAAAAFLERATALTPDPARRGVRALAAGHEKLYATEFEAGLALVATAELCPLPPLEAAHLERLRASLCISLGRGIVGSQMLLDAARRLEPLEPDTARRSYLGALGTWIMAGRLNDGRSINAAAEVARGAPPAAEPGVMDLLLDGLSARFTEGYAASLPALRHAIDACVRADGVSEPVVEWMWSALPIPPEVWDDDAWHRVTSWLVALSRDAAALNTLPVALDSRACVEVHFGDFAAASALIDEAVTLNQAIGERMMLQAPLELAAWSGDETSALNLIDTADRIWSAAGVGRVVAHGAYAAAVLHNGLARYDDAFVASRRACEHDDIGFYGRALAELVEAAVRTGELDVAADSLRQLDERTVAAGTDWALGVRARARALMAEGEPADRLYRESIDRLARTRLRVDLARSHLLYGEWLRRENRRLDARTQLRAAHDMFTGMGVGSFGERARRELLATGATARKRAEDTREALTAQEAQIARLAAQRHTNSEIGTQLFISARTVEYHLSKVFTKLGITSRRQLRGALQAAAASAPG